MGSSDKKKKATFKPKNSSGKYQVMYQNYLQMKGGSTELSNWKNKQENGPVQYYPKIVEKYGNPDVLANVPGGVCIWYINNRNGDAHSELLLRDEFVPHSKPKKHFDFFYSYIKVHIPKERLFEILSISGSIGYDGLKHLLYARCGSFEANYATFRTVFDKLNNSQSDYGTNINNKEDEGISNEEFVKEQVRLNQNKYSEELSRDYYL